MIIIRENEPIEVRFLLYQEFIYYFGRMICNLLGQIL
jgi:hypothetical protein